MKVCPRLLSALVVWLTVVPLTFAQASAPHAKLLSLLPDDFAVCVVMRDLRGQTASWAASDWMKAFRKSPAGQAFLEAPELKQFEHWQKDLKKHFDLDWSTLRDDLLGDTVLLAYSPGPTNRPDDERGLVLLHARKPERFRQFMGRLNELQKKSGELKSLTDLQHKGVTYHRRVQNDKTQFYCVDGSVVAIASREEWIQAVLDNRAITPKTAAWSRRFERAGAERAFLTLCINPRTITPDFIKQGHKGDALPGYWQALDAIFLTFALHEEAELGITVQADVDRLPKWTQAAFTAPATPSSLWQRFPEQSIVTIAARTDFVGTVEALKALTPEKDRKKLVGLDAMKDLLSSIGPDWGVCVIPAKDARQLPQSIVAVAIKPGSKDQSTDQGLFKAVQLFAVLGISDYNKNHADPIRIETVMQDKVEVKYLANDKLFPPGVQPACALKDGFLLFASSPDAILQFRAHETKTDLSKGVPMIRLSTRELAKLLRQRQTEIVDRLKIRQQMSDSEAKRHVDSAIALMDLFETLTLSQHASAGQANWTLRLTPALPPGSSR